MEEEEEEQKWWQLFNEADQERKKIIHTVLDSSSDEEDQPGNDQRVVVLQNGNIHVCLGISCPHARADSGALICELTGVEVGRMQFREPESSTRNPCGGSDEHSSFLAAAYRRRKRDAFSISSDAWNRASTLKTNTASDQVGTTSPKAKRKRKVEGSSFDGKYRDPSPEKIERLSMDASKIILLLLPILNKNSFAGDNAPKRLSIPREKVPPFDSALVTITTLKRYVDECVSGLNPLNYVTLHDALIRTHALPQGSPESSLLFPSNANRCPTSLRLHLIQLIVSLWCILKHTPFMAKKTRGSDSFRCFASGTIYALKRGVLSHNLHVVPQMQALTSYLPSNRTTKLSSDVKSLQSASHRGISILHKALNSIDDLDDVQRFESLFRLSQVARVSGIICKYFQNATF